VLAILIATNYSELKWAAKLLPNYFDGRIPGTSLDQRLISDAHGALYKERNPDKSLKILDELLRMDPASADGYLFTGKSHLALKNLADAEAAFLRTIELDPTLIDPYLDLAKIYLQQGQPDKARVILQQGHDYFQSNVASYQPVLDPSVIDAYNERATSVYRDYQEKLQIMQALLERLSAARTPESS